MPRKHYRAVDGPRPVPMAEIQRCARSVSGSAGGGEQIRLDRVLAGPGVAGPSMPRRRPIWPAAVEVGGTGGTAAGIVTRAATLGGLHRSLLDALVTTAISATGFGLSASPAGKGGISGRCGPALSGATTIWGWWSSARGIVDG